MSDSTDGDPDEELAAAVDELLDVLGELRGEIEPRRRGPLGLPDPPSPGELLRFTDRQAIPFAIAVLEANIRALELLRAAIRLAESGETAGTEARRAGDRAASLGRSTLQRLDDALADLEEAASEGGLPRQSDARDLLTEARRLRAEVEDALAARMEDDRDDSREGGGTVIDVDEATGERGDEPRDGPEINVEGELRSIKQELGKLDEERSGDGSDAAGNDSDGGPSDEGAEADEPDAEDDE